MYIISLRAVTILLALLRCISTTDNISKDTHSDIVIDVVRISDEARNRTNGGNGRYRNSDDFRNRRNNLTRSGSDRLVVSESSSDALFRGYLKNDLLLEDHSPSANHSRYSTGSKVKKMKPKIMRTSSLDSSTVAAAESSPIALTPSPEKNRGAVDDSGTGSNVRPSSSSFKSKSPPAPENMRSGQLDSANTNNNNKSGIGPNPKSSAFGSARLRSRFSASGSIVSSSSPQSTGDVESSTTGASTSSAKKRKRLPYSSSISGVGSATTSNSTTSSSSSTVTAEPARQNYYPRQQQQHILVDRENYGSALTPFDFGRKIISQSSGGTNYLENPSSSGGNHRRRVVSQKPQEAATVTSEDEETPPSHEDMDVAKEKKTVENNHPQALGVARPPSGRDIIAYPFSGRKPIGGAENSSSRSNRQSFFVNTSRPTVMTTAVVTSKSTQSSTVATVSHFVTDKLENPLENLANESSTKILSTAVVTSISVKSRANDYSNKSSSESNIATAIPPSPSSSSTSSRRTVPPTTASSQQTKSTSDRERISSSSAVAATSAAVAIAAKIGTAAATSSIAPSIDYLINESSPTKASTAFDAEFSSTDSAQFDDDRDNSTVTTAIEDIDIVGANSNVSIISSDADRSTIRPPNVANVTTGDDGWSSPSIGNKSETDEIDGSGEETVSLSSAPPRHRHNFKTSYAVGKQTHEEVGITYQAGFHIITYVLAGLGVIPLVIGIFIVSKMLMNHNKKQIFDGSEYSSEYNRSPLEINSPSAGVGVTSSPVATKLPRVSHHMFQNHWETTEKKSCPPIFSVASFNNNNNSNWEFPREKLRLQTILGQGNFGQVWKAEADDISGHEGLTRLVAVKMVKEISSTREKDDLIRELLIMQHLGSHPNVVTLLGCCTEREPYMLIMEYVMYGKLLAFLRDHRTRSHYFNFSDSGGDLLTPRDLTVFAYCVARGMEFISSKQVIHRDLAARNILVDHNKLCKIADFGMSRHVGEAGTVYEHRQSKGALPIRWMAPESLHYNVYTHKTDVWSFGILMWEIITLGSMPYASMGARLVMKRVKEGYRLEKPKYCKSQLFSIISRCWCSDPNKRPSFAELKQELGSLLEDPEHHGNYVDIESLVEEISESVHISHNERIVS